MRNLTISIVSYNCKKILEDCLKSIFLNIPKTKCEIIVVDNKSTDKVEEMVRDKFPQVKLLINNQNMGFAAAHNKAYLESGGKYILVLNPDIIVQPNSIEILIDFMDNNSDAGVVCPKLKNIDGSLQYSCRTFYKLSTILFRRTLLGKIFPAHKILSEHLMSDLDHNNVMVVDWALGGSMLIRRKAVKENRIFDERFFVYFEDVDLCYRMKKNGWKVYYVPDAVMIHRHIRDSAQKSFNRAKFEHLKSFIKFYLKYKGRLKPNR